MHASISRPRIECWHRERRVLVCRSIAATRWIDALQGFTRVGLGCFTRWQDRVKNNVQTGGNGLKFADIASLILLTCKGRTRRRGGGAWPWVLKRTVGLPDAVCVGTLIQVVTRKGDAMSHHCPFPVRSSDNRSSYRVGTAPGLSLCIAVLAALLGYAGVSHAGPIEHDQDSHPEMVSVAAP